MAYEDVTKKYKKDHPKSIATGVYDVTRSKALEKKKGSKHFVGGSKEKEKEYTYKMDKSIKGL